MHNRDFAPRRAEQMQFWRFIAFFHVFLQHTMVWNGFLHYPSFKSGLIAISFFFMLSGALSGYNAPRQEQKPSLMDVFRYGLKKMRGFYPLYLTLLVISLFSRPLPELLVQRDAAALMPELGRLAVHLCMLQSWFPSTYFDFTGVGWFFSTIVMLSLTQLPFAFWLNCLQKKGRRWIWIALGALAVLTIALQYVLTFAPDAYYSKYIFPPARLGEYLIGMIIGFLVRTHEGRSSSGASAAMELAVCVLWVASIFLCPDNWMDIAVWWLVPNAAVLAVFLQGNGAVSSLFRHKALSQLGSCVFECVLIHGIIIDFYFFVCPVASMPGGMAGAVSLTLCLLATVLMARRLHSSKRI